MNKNHLQDIKNLTLPELTALLIDQGKEKFRAKQIIKWIYARGVTSFDEMTDLSKVLREDLKQRFVISDWSPEVVETSSDGTRKYLYRLSDGETVESVRIPMEAGKDTLCISTQVGCAMQCQFCLTGTFGLTRHLEASEIVNQVCASLKDGPLQNIVLMGMGEPLHNLDNVIKALEILYLAEGCAFGPRRVTLSTSGLVPQMYELAQRVKVGLAVSLNATTDELRDQLMPINQKYPLVELMKACREIPLEPRKRITFEYILIGGVNDSRTDAKRLVKLLHGLRAKVNLIPYNEHPGSAFKSPSRRTVEEFQSYLLDRDIVAIKRASKGQDISAACGQLKGKLEKRDE
ncbi:MAG: 23S rRNA (adenine(2503)-C(2))-methyltransferase RlmN [Geopsychrobacter sp.]|nr:23S rRNA (adenine(2503)-C(2))-methyltransferase RlmN [Geopsychrobacter sp.]